MFAASGLLVTIIVAWFHGEKGRQKVSRLEALLLALAVLPFVIGSAWLVPRMVQPATERSVQVVEVARPADARSIAVLPLRNLSRDAESDYFSDGVTEAIAIQLGRIPDLRVIAHTSALRYKDRDDPPRAIGAALGAAVLLGGSIQREANRVRVTARLVDAASGEQLWADEYDRDLNDIFVIQRDIADSIVVALNATLTSQERERFTRSSTADTSAYNQYLLGRFHFAKGTFTGWRRSIEHFERAAARDSTFCLAYAALADAHVFLAYYGLVRAHEAIPAARAAALHALRIDSMLGAMLTLLSV